MINIDSDIALLIGLVIGLGVGFGMAYFILKLQTQNQKVIIGRNKEGQIDSIVQTS